MTRIEEFTARMNKLVEEYHDEISVGMVVVNDQTQECIFAGNWCPVCATRAMAFLAATQQIGHSHENNGDQADIQRQLNARNN